jgi:hypothetical protein
VEEMAHWMTFTAGFRPRDRKALHAPRRCWVVNSVLISLTVIFRPGDALLDPPGKCRPGRRRWYESAARRLAVVS